MKTDPSRTAVAKLPAVIDGSIHITKVAQTGGLPIYQPAAVCKYSELRLQQCLIDVEPKLIPPASQTYSTLTTVKRAKQRERAQQSGTAEHARAPAHRGLLCQTILQARDATRSNENAECYDAARQEQQKRGHSSSHIHIRRRPPLPPPRTSASTAARGRRLRGDGLARLGQKAPPAAAEGGRLHTTSLSGAESVTY
eukprot:COSAG01_NODE_5514_length_4207_cov_2.756934_1_plen_197_part_00